MRIKSILLINVRNSFLPLEFYDLTSQISNPDSNLLNLHNILGLGIECNLRTDSRDCGHHDGEFEYITTGSEVVTDRLLNSPGKFITSNSITKRIINSIFLNNLRSCNISKAPYNLLMYL